MAASSSSALSRTKTFEKDGQRFFIDRVDFQGALFKQSSWLKEWRRRWLYEFLPLPRPPRGVASHSPCPPIPSPLSPTSMLVGSRLFFAKDRHSDPHGFIDLKNAMTVKSLTGPKVCRVGEGVGVVG